MHRNVQEQGELQKDVYLFFQQQLRSGSALLDESVQ